MRSISLIVLILVSFVWGFAASHYRVFPYGMIQWAAKAVTYRGKDIKRLAFSVFPGRADTVFLGDSLTEDGDWESLTGWPSTANRGIGGETASEMKTRLASVLQMQPRRVFLMAGINDLNKGRNPIEVAETIGSILAELRTAGVDVMLQSTLECRNDGCPRNEVRSLNELLVGNAEQLDVVFLDLNETMSDDGGLKAEFTRDGTHLTEAGYAAWATALKAIPALASPP